MVDALPLPPFSPAHISYIIVIKEDTSTRRLILKLIKLYIVVVAWKGFKSTLPSTRLYNPIVNGHRGEIKLTAVQQYGSSSHFHDDTFILCETRMFILDDLITAPMTLSPSYHDLRSHWLHVSTKTNIKTDRDYIHKTQHTK